MAEQLLWTWTTLINNVCFLIYAVVPNNNIGKLRIILKYVFFSGFSICNLEIDKMKDLLILIFIEQYQSLWWMLILCKHWDEMKEVSQNMTSSLMCYVHSAPVQITALHTFPSLWYCFVSVLPSNSTNTLNKLLTVYYCFSGF